MFKLLKRFGGSYRVNLILGPLCKLIEVVFDLFTPIIVAYMIDAGVGTHSVQPVLAGGGILLAMAAVAILFALACQKMASRASQGMGTSIRHSLYEHINALSHADLDRFGTPSLATRITNDVNQVQLAIALGIRQLMRWPFLAVGSLVAALAIDVRLGLIFVVSMAVVGGLFWFVMKACIPYYRSMQAKLDRIALIVREGLSGVRVVRAFVREGHERRRLADAAQDQASTAIAVGRLSSVLNPVTFLVMYLAVCAILWAGGIQVNIGGLTQGQVVAFVSYMTQALLSIVYVANLVVVFTKASASAARVNEVLACQPSVTDGGRRARWSDVGGSAGGLPGVAERADGAGLPDAAEQVRLAEQTGASNGSSRLPCATSLCLPRCGCGRRARCDARAHAGTDARRDRRNGVGQVDARLAHSAALRRDGRGGRGAWPRCARVAAQAA